MTGDDLAPFDARLGALIGQLEPAQRRQLAREIARAQRQREARRIAAQRNPDGSAFAPRKPTLRKRKGAIRRAMFNRLRAYKWLKADATADRAVVTFADQVQRIAQVHHHGLRDKVNRRGGPEVDYPSRRLLGLDDESIDAIGEAVLAHLAR